MKKNYTMTTYAVRKVGTFGYSAPYGTFRTLAGAKSGLRRIKNEVAKDYRIDPYKRSDEVKLLMIVKHVETHTLIED